VETFKGETTDMNKQIRQAGFFLAALTVAAATVWTVQSGYLHATPAEETVASAQPRPLTGTRVGFVDIDGVTRRAKFYRDMVAELEKEVESKKASILSKSEKLIGMGKELKKQRSVLSDAEYEKKDKEITELGREIEDEQKVVNQLMAKNNEEKVAPAVDRILKTVKDVAQEEGYDLVVTGELVLYNSAAVDLSEKVLQRLDGAAAPAAGSGVAAPAAPEKKASSKRAPALSGK
jgi:outer membrane protein